MIQPIIFNTKRAVLLSFLLALPFTETTTALAQHHVLVRFQSGTAIYTTLDPFQWEWTDVSIHGVATKRQVSSSQIRRLQVMGESISQLVESSQALMDQLNDDDYATREIAEQLLTERLKTPSAPQLRTLLEPRAEHPILEVRHRVQRLLRVKQSGSVNRTASLQLDRLQLTDGQVLLGDVGQATLTGQFRDKPLTFSLSQINYLEFLDTAQSSLNRDHFVNRNESFTVVPSAQPISTDRRQALRLIDFETDSFGQSLAKDQRIDNAFLEWGVKITTPDENSHIGVSPHFELNSPSRPTGKNSICVVNVRSGISRRHLGEMVFEFCMPGNPHSPAGVHQLELYVADIDNPRDFILQAFNADGQIIASVEASDETNCCFAVESSEPIVKAWLLSNPYLVELSREVDKSFAVDNLSFSPPVPVNGRGVNSTRNCLRTFSGDCLVSEERWTIRDGKVWLKIVETGTTYHFNWDEVESLSAISATPSTVPTNRWLALQKDRSVIAIQPGEQFQPIRLSDQHLLPDELLAVWPAGDFLRFPTVAANRVAVFPTSQFASQTLELGDQYFEFPAESTDKHFQPVMFAERPANDELAKALLAEDPSPKDFRFRWDVTGLAQKPSIWFHAPRLPQPRAGAVGLAGGEVWVFGPGQSWQLSEINNSRVELIDESGTRISFNWSEMSVVRFPIEE